VFKNVTGELVDGFFIRYSVFDVADSAFDDIIGITVIDGERNVFVIRDVVCTLAVVSAFEVSVILELYEYVFALTYPITEVVCVVRDVNVVSAPIMPCVPVKPCVPCVPVEPCAPVEP